MSKKLQPTLKHALDEIVAKAMHNTTLTTATRHSMVLPWN